jgi:hypothetical protein
MVSTRSCQNDFSTGQLDRNEKGRDFSPAKQKKFFEKIRLVEVRIPGEIQVGKITV